MSIRVYLIPSREIKMNEENERLTLEQAYCAMFYFLKKEYEMTKSDDIGGLLSSLDGTIWTDGGSADPAAWKDWLDAVKKMRSSSLIQIKTSTET